MVAALKGEVKDKWGIGVLDLWDDEEMLSVMDNKELYDAYMHDTIHPTKLGYSEWWGPKFYEFLYAYYNS